jgi:Flp pilus assembly protein TadG
MRIKEMRQNRQKARRGVRGQAIVEVALMAPWIFFLFVGVLDFGFYSYAFICTQNAARVAAIANGFSTGNATDSVSACNIVIQEMNSLPNTRSLTDCGVSPLVVTVGAAGLTGPDGAEVAQVTVTYTPILIIPIPGVLGQISTVTRTVQVPILNSAPTS